MTMKVEKTLRRTSFINFSDQDDNTCSLQVSSRFGDEKFIWFGLNHPILCYEEGGSVFSLPKGVISFSRMHLRQSQVKEILPLLQRFAATGDLE